MERWHGAEPGLTSHLQETKATDCSMSHLGFSRDDNDGLYRLQRVELPSSSSGKRKLKTRGIDEKCIL